MVDDNSHKGESWWMIIVIKVSHDGYVNSNLSEDNSYKSTSR